MSKDYKRTTLYFDKPIYKSEMRVGNLTIMNKKHFNLFHKILYKLLLGIEIKDIKE